MSLTRPAAPQLLRWDYVNNGPTIAEQEAYIKLQEMEIKRQEMIYMSQQQAGTYVRIEPFSRIGPCNYETTKPALKKVLLLTRRLK